MPQQSCTNTSASASFGLRRTDLDLDMRRSEGTCVNAEIFAGCKAPEAAPMQGDVRLVPLPGIESPTQPCDAVHFGYAQIFNDGLWGSVCATGIDRSHGKWTVDATVICRQLGFSFGNLMDARAPTFTATAGSTPPVFATDVLCTGAEDRFSDCFFPEAFGANEDASSGPGLSAGCFPDSLLAVMCRRFPMEGVAFK